MNRKLNHYEKRDIRFEEHKESKKRARQYYKWLSNITIAEEDVLKIKTKDDNGFKEADRHAERLLGLI